MQSESLFWRFEAEALARRSIEPAGDSVKDGLVNIGSPVSWNEPAQPSVEVFDRPFLPGGVRIAEVRIDIHVVELFMGGELRPTVKRNGSTGGGGKLR